jgi:hypothetical protein
LHLPCAFCMPHLFWSSVMYHLNIICRSVRFTKLLIVQCTPRLSRHASEVCPQRPSICVFAFTWATKFHTHTNLLHSLCLYVSKGRKTIDSELHDNRHVLNLIYS